MRRRGTPVSREALYEEVWTDAVTVVAPRYGLSDVGLVKICKKLGIPVPPRGYWAKVKAGRPTRKVPLPALPAGARDLGLESGVPPHMVDVHGDADRAAAARIQGGAHVERLLQPPACLRQAARHLQRSCQTGEHPRPGLGRRVGHERHGRLVGGDGGRLGVPADHHVPPEPLVKHT